MTGGAAKSPAVGGLAGWPIVGWAFLIAATGSVVILLMDGVGEAGLRAVTRASALFSLMLFTSAFVASALHRTWPAPLSRWMRANRRYLGVSFAVSHAIHLMAILALASAAPTFTPNPVTVVGGGLGYVFIAAMTATSFNRSAAWVGPRAWRWLHTVGVYYIWGIFLVTYLPRAMHSAGYLVQVAVLLAAIGLRGFVRWSRPPATVPPRERH